MSSRDLKSVRLVVCIIFCTLSHNVHASLADPIFVTEWNTKNAGPGTSCNSCITISIHPGSTYKYDVDWENDGTFDVFNQTGPLHHDYLAAGIKTVVIRGTFPSIYFKDHPDRVKLTNVIVWETLSGLAWKKPLMAA